MLNEIIDMTALYRLCNKYRLFTCGDNEQYDKMFALAGNGITQDELALILYMCSDCEIDIIREWITPLFNGEKEVK
jgi:hypothetical protein